MEQVNKNSSKTQSITARGRNSLSPLTDLGTLVTQKRRWYGEELSDNGDAELILKEMPNTGHL